MILDDVVVDHHSRIRKAIIDKHETIPHHTKIENHPEEDPKQFTITPRRIVAAPKGYFS